MQGPIKRGFAVLAVMLAFLQSDISISAIGAGLSAVNSVLLIRLAFSAGKYVQRVETHDKEIENHHDRILKLERDFTCRAEDCPVRSVE